MSEHNGKRASTADPQRADRDDPSVKLLGATNLAALTFKSFTVPSGDVPSAGAIARDLRAKVELAAAGDLSDSEAILVTHVHALNAVFNNLAYKAANADSLELVESYLKLALRAQSQTRSTVETLSEMKGPKSVAFVRQANIAHGDQQVNNHRQRSSESETNSAKQTERRDSDARQALDTRGSASPGRSHQGDETLAAVNWPSDAGR
ncbi:hypothetical protein [Spectribacter hydrogenoxidans]|uniref:Uncharacterized protein n=1 Tax=Spectribacter hydrogenoxidans TaxID=3075608 RepID=A0ABU3BY52_9GAMM|nr:hypothetical protein [Salinisphaera sp. W335]MDT0634218.1 hypothetical protein [Salinisphaera sp. W335]